ncbi:MAG: DNA recombination protein RmuC [Bacteroidota bacterium]|nr:DNA recombination protein RmuC [Bacteroidota bacterium]
MEMVYLIAGLLIGLLVGWLLSAKKGQASYAAELNNERLLKQDALIAEARLSAENKSITEKLEKQKSELEEVQRRLTLEFENIATRILRQNASDFRENNLKTLGDILTPFKERIQSFEKQVQATYNLELRDKVSLQQEVRGLFELSKKLSDDANNLTMALKGDVKKQGNWGEVILERVLERSGLIKGEEYEMQYSVRSNEGDVLRPDVVIRLPENKHIIVDSKVSLVAYEQYVSAELPDEKDRHMKAHIDSIRNHIKGLSEKSYQNAGGIDSPDFVLLFMPIEPAFSAAVQYDVDLFNDAWERKIVIVSPSTLLATLRTVSSVWKHEKQTQNALEIARQGGEMFDKFSAFLKDIEAIGDQIDKLEKVYGEARKKLADGKGNLINRARRLEQLGAKTSKVFPGIFLTNDNEEE